MLRKIKVVRSFGTDVKNGLSTKYSVEQLRQMDDLVILVDKHDNTVGPATKKEAHQLLADGTSKLHRAFSVFLFNSNKELLLQQRSDTKITFPKYFTNTCCSHPRYDYVEMGAEEYRGVKIAAQRRMEFELGISKDLVPLDEIFHLTRILYSARSDNTWAEHELDHILVCKANVVLNVNKDEVQYTEYMNQTQMRDFMTNAEKDNKLVTPWFKYIYKNFLFEWWDNLDNLSKFSDENIHMAGDQDNVS